MRGQPKSSREWLETVEKIAEQALRAGEVLRRLRSFARKGETKIVPCDAASLVADTLRLAELDVRHHRATVRLDAEESVPPVQVDPIQIQQVVLNLVRNALEAMDGMPQLARSLVVTVGRDGSDRVVVRVADRGSGVSEAAAAELYHPFFSTKPENLGVGLSMSQSIIRAHGGTLAFTRNPEGGSTFAFTLPVAAEKLP
jgi:C4-dicarboxylate-specific signal transduction histidine kinase